MRLTAVEFNGYKRLHSARCNVDGPTIAFIGPNESGKSSVLQGLQWLTASGSLPLAARDGNRQDPPRDDRLVVAAHFRLDEDDHRALSELDIDPETPVTKDNLREFRLARRSSGETVTMVDLALRRDTTRFAEAQEAIATLGAAVRDASETLDDNGIDTQEPLLTKLRAAIAGAHRADNEAELVQLEAGIISLKAYGTDLLGIEGRWTGLSALKRALERAVRALEAAEVSARKGDPDQTIRSLLRGRAPKFMLFADDDREIHEKYPLQDENVRANPGAPFLNLLTVAGTSVDELWDAISSGVSAQMRTLEKRINGTLMDRLHPIWSQSKLAVVLALNESGIVEVNIDEIDRPEGFVSPISERSDGLRTFLGLVCFLIASKLAVPPVLLIDEAERNLHYDAQAELVRVLTQQLHVHKVLYTTHSPGCLPLDLGTGIRVVKRNPTNPSTSTLENSFWTDSEPGFSHLLFAMGAKAAAFSAFRKALLAEGVSEMILLPTLLRRATANQAIDFQVAFGLSNMSVAQAMTSVALITSFLVDGDKEGDVKKKRLQDAGVPNAHILQLPNGKAIEDLIDRRQYMDVVNAFLEESGVEAIPPSAVDPSLTVAHAVDVFVKSHRGMSSGVGHKIIATRLAVLGDDLKLAPGAQRFLTKLRADTEKSFERPYSLKSAEAAR